jgi:hypothetical protein
MKDATLYALYTIQHLFKRMMVSDDHIRAVNAGMYVMMIDDIIDREGDRDRFNAYAVMAEEYIGRIRPEIIQRLREECYADPDKAMEVMARLYAKAKREEGDE